MERRLLSTVPYQLFLVTMKLLSTIAVMKLLCLSVFLGIVALVVFSSTYKEPHHFGSDWPEGNINNLGRPFFWHNPYR